MTEPSPYATPQSRDQQSGVKWLLIAVVVLLFALIVAMGWGMLRYQQAVAMAQRAAMEAEMARAEAEHQRAISEEMIQRLEAERSVEQPETGQ